MILAEIRVYANRQREFDAILGIVDADISVPELNFVFGEASFPGKEALISVWRLRPEFYGEVPDETIFLSRVVKEAVHEIGHTIGLQHCPCSSCVMHFSNSIVDTENKQTWFCAKCHLKAASRIQSLKN
jgi:archaemetzincin